MSAESMNLSRRSLIQIAVGGAALIGVGGLSACASGGGGNSGPTAGGGGTAAKDASNPFGVNKADPIEVVIFNGGYGDAYGAEDVKIYNKWAGSEAAKMTSTVKIASTLQPRFSGGNPPEVFDNSGADAIPRATLVSQNQVADLTELLNAPSVDDPNTKISDVLLPAVAKAGSFDGVMRELNYVFSMWGFWYSSKLFDEKGWKVPKTWDDFMSLCDKIKSDGKMAPFIHTGVHTQYMLAMMATMAVKNGGKDYALKLDNLEPDAWTSEPMMLTAQAVAELAKNKYIFEGAEGLDHTTSQTEWLLGKAAIIPCGSWIENEMKGKVPDGFDMKVFPTPSLKGDKMPLATIRGGAGEPFMVSQNAKNRAGGLEYLRQMLSKEAVSKFSELTGNLVATKDASKMLKDPSTALKSVADAASAAGDNILTIQFDSWYADLKNAGKDEVRNLMTNKSTPEEFCQHMQKAADSVKNDPKVKKYTAS